ncbi:hypothetical protein KCH_70170 [Kitasatospora cheerisanensis KCTC 2395]|uniref:Uncharacterized protein n=1 Tax=Kitasatospora cheerisanensis KCTC 2395 TaxID=1348663 RepID=A0A066YT18_9ACTN|nr:hypothetical protein KCH_70170 [Kitasatospora cheerisanensis KCTC 2395]
MKGITGRAILMALSPSVHPHQWTGTANCWSCELVRAGRPLPDSRHARRSLTPLPGYLCTATAGTARRRPLMPAGHPARPSALSPH